MRSFRTSIIVLMMVFVIAVGAMANDMVFMTGHGDVFTGSQLDDEFPDSLSYHDYDGSYYYFSSPTAALDIYSGVRFTAPSEFIVQGIRFLADEPVTITTVQFGIYTNNAGQPGTLLYSWDAVPTSISGGWVECIMDEADFETIDEGVDFWIVIGPQPGFANDSWSVALDRDGAEGNRNKAAIGTGSSPTNLTSEIEYDFIITVGGQYANSFFDLCTVSLFNDIQRFQFDADSVVTFSARVANSGNIASSAGTATFEVLDSDEAVVFTTTADFEAVAGHRADTTLVTATETWSPAADGRYIAKVTFDADSAESEVGNNTYLLLQDVVNAGDWLLYDDGTFETNVGSSVGQGWGVPFHPMSYPAKMDSLAFYFPAAATNINLRLYTFDSTGLYFAWETTTSVVEGWNTFEVADEAFPDGINIADGYFIGAYMYADGVSFTSDSNPPTSAANPDMPTASCGVYTDGLDLSDNTGNWAIRGKVVEGTAPAELVFPSTPVLFGDVAAGESLTMYYVFENQGGIEGTINSVSIVGNIYDASEMTITNTFPMTVAGESTDSIGFTWAPGEDSPGLAAGIFIGHSGLEEAFVCEIRGNALGVDVISTDAIPDNYFLAQNHPNPFNPETSIQFGLPNAGHVRLTVYNVMGQEVARLVDSQMNAGTFAVTLDGSKLSSGIYFYSLEANGFHSMKKMSLLK